MRQREDDVVIVDREDFGAPRLAPQGLVEVLALGAMTVAAGVVGNDLVAAAVTLIHMPSERRRPTQFNGAHHPVLFEGHGCFMPVAIAFAVAAKDISHFQQRPAHGTAWRLGWRQGIQRALGLLDMLQRHVGVAGGGPGTIVSQQDLDGAQV